MNDARLIHHVITVLRSNPGGMTVGRIASAIAKATGQDQTRVYARLLSLEHSGRLESSGIVLTEFVGRIRYVLSIRGEPITIQPNHHLSRRQRLWPKGSDV
jgi:hypothetical protein